MVIDFTWFITQPNIFWNGTLPAVPSTTIDWTTQTRRNSWSNGLVILFEFPFLVLKHRWWDVSNAYNVTIRMVFLRPCLTKPTASSIMRTPSLAVCYFTLLLFVAKSFDDVAILLVFNTWSINTKGSSLQLESLSFFSCLLCNILLRILHRTSF